MSQAASLASLERAAAAGQVSPSAAVNIRRWLTEAPFERYRAQLVQDIAADRWQILDDAFYAVLEFGTGGRRGKMYPVGTNVLNERTIAESTRGLADYVTSRKGKDSPRSCVIARDTRHNSPEFAALCARVLAAAGFKVYLFPEPRSTPLLSHAVRFLGCDAGIMITASHNPPSDNGFKCYAATGGQVIPPDDDGIIACVKAASDREIPEISFDQGVIDGSIVLVGKQVDDSYLSLVVSQHVSPECRDLSIVYTPMHGVGETSVAAALKLAGFSRVNILASQRTPDGDFPNVPGHVSNPEIPKTLAASIAEAQGTGADLVLASDPDADRIGVGVPVTGDPAGAWTTLDGNQIGILLTAFVIKETEARGRLRHDHYVITTLVSSLMTRALCEREGVRIEDDLLVGFKWIGQRIDQSGHAGFLFAFEESHGYLKGDHVRDKDAAVAALLMAELAATVKARRQNRAGISGRPLHRRRPPRRAAHQQGDRGSSRRRADAAAHGDVPREPTEDGGRPDDHRGLRLPDPRNPRPRRLGRDPPAPRTCRRPIDLPHRRPRMPLRRASVGHRTEDQVLSLCPHTD